MSTNRPRAVALPPPGFADTPHPPLKPAERLVAHVEQVEVARPLSQVVRAAEAMDLADAIDPTSRLPHVIGTHDLTDIPFGTPGARRIVFLSDGTTLSEQVLERTLSDAAYRFRYVVWNYSTPAARPILYGLGDFRYTAAAPDRTHIHWTYAFELRRDRFPGVLGPIGDRLLKAAFLDRAYAAMMRGTLARTKAAAEAA